MARFGIAKQFGEGVKAENVYDAAQVAFKETGWEVYKLRPIAYLAEARKTGAEGYMLANIIASAFSPEYKVALKSDTASQAMIDQEAETVLAALDKALAAKKK